MSNKKDDNVSTPAQQQVQGFIQTQYTLPPKIPHNEQNTIIIQFKYEQQRRRFINNLLISVAIILIAVGAVVWVLNITDMVKGPWSSICAALFTSVGTIITLLQPPLSIHIHGREEVTAKVTIHPGEVITID